MNFQYFIMPEGDKQIGIEDTTQYDQLKDNFNLPNEGKLTSKNR